MSDLRAPFPWFGGKSRAASTVWAALGDVDQYVEPFAGSLAVLLGRPSTHEGTCETVNDRDAYLANFWRALAAAPEEVAKHADWPVNETDLFARHLWLVNEGSARIAAMEADPEFYDAKVAGWWVWGLCSWIGSGWCSGTGPWGKDGLPLSAHWRQLPHLGNAGLGVNRKLPHLGDAGRGVNRQFPVLGNNASVPWRHGRSPLVDYFGELRDRLRRVRVCCGDWSRVVTSGALNYGRTVGVFLDPPYSGDVRTKNLYASDDHSVSADVREWAIEHGDDPRLRIVLAGYEGEHEMPATWRLVTYSASKSYGSRAGGGVNKENRHKERLWCSPHCLGNETTLNGHQQLALLGEMDS